MFNKDNWDTHSTKEYYRKLRYSEILKPLVEIFILSYCNSYENKMINFSLSHRNFHGN